ncbi:IS3 family transposase [Amycolatopsis sp. YIM 10]|uniref:IS3 family transposase n=1 Tax=Amycolatopsis sp. YIM 10 TaxID=2653857 RepID=UPI001D150130
MRRPGFYEWLAAAPARAERAAGEARLAAEITEIHTAHRGAYGSPRVTAELRRRGAVVNHKLVERIMRERAIAGLTRRRRHCLTRPRPRHRISSAGISPPTHPASAWSVTLCSVTMRAGSVTRSRFTQSFTTRPGEHPKSLKPQYAPGGRRQGESCMRGFVRPRPLLVRQGRFQRCYVIARYCRPASVRA